MFYRVISWGCRCTFCRDVTLHDARASEPKKRKKKEKNASATHLRDLLGIIIPDDDDFEEKLCASGGGEQRQNEADSF